MKKNLHINDYNYSNIRCNLYMIESRCFWILARRKSHSPHSSQTSKGEKFIPQRLKVLDLNGMFPAGLT